MNLNDAYLNKFVIRVLSKIKETIEKPNQGYRHRSDIDI